MNLSASQVKEFWRLWPQACRAQHWTREDGLTTADIDLKRKEFLAGCGFKSLTLVDRTDGFTRVLNGLKVLIGVSVKAGLEVGDPTLNKARNIRHVIANEIEPCLAVYVQDVYAYITAIMEDKNRWWKLDKPARDITLEDLDAKPIFRRGKDGNLQEWPSTLEQLLMTLNARLHAKRREAGHSIHDMKVAARVPCHCKACSMAGIRVVIDAQKEHDSQAESGEFLTHENPF